MARAGSTPSPIRSTDGCRPTKDGALSTDYVVQSGGTLAGNGGYAAGKSTLITGGELKLNSGGSTGDLTLDNGSLNGSGGNTLTQQVIWKAHGIDAILRKGDTAARLGGGVLVTAQW